MATIDPGELEELQRLSDQYHADLPGPLIGDRLPITALITEYAQADPTYVVKTQALAATHSGYRPIKGDGQCGWRGTNIGPHGGVWHDFADQTAGAVFGFFETLLQHGDPQLVAQEELRLRSFSQAFEMIGLDVEPLEMLFDYTWELFGDIKQALERQDRSDGVLLRLLNDSGPSDSIVYHFKSMTGAFMTLNPDNYEPFLEMTMDEYRLRRIEPAQQEIDQVGLQALTTGVIAPAGFGLEVLYLDRSVGDEVTPHQFAVGEPTINMLYRPGHYDMIYRGAQTVPVMMMMEDQDQTVLSQDMLSEFDAGVLEGSHPYFFSSPPDISSASTTLNHGGAESGPDQTNNHESARYAIGEPMYRATGCVTTDSFETDVGADPVAQVAQLSYSQPNSTVEKATYRDSNSKAKATTAYRSPRQHACPPLDPAKVISTLAKMDGARIRLNEKCLDYQHKHQSLPLTVESMPLNPSHSPAHFRNVGFQPQMWQAQEEHNKT